MDDDDIVGEEDGEGVGAEGLPGGEDCMAEAELMVLDHGGDFEATSYLSNAGDEVRTPPGGEEFFEVGAGAEVVFNGGLAGRGNDNGAGEAGPQRFFEAVLDDGLVDDGEEFFRDGLGCWEEAGTPSGGGDYYGFDWTQGSHV